MSVKIQEGGGIAYEIIDTEKKLIADMPPAGGVTWIEPPSDRNVLIAYLRIKVASADWHAVSDAANDLRVLDGK